MEIIPLQDYVIIRTADSIVGDNKPHSGIIIPDGVEDPVETMNQGKIIKLSEVHSAALAEGDLVIFRAHMFDEVEELLHDRKYSGLLMGKQEHIIAIIKPNEPKKK